jgi:spore coat polysaccharide biosynthesis protein SpsF (cytidylyltransferase family)
MAGRAMLGWVIHRLRQAKRIDRVIVATSTETDDNAIEVYCTKAEIACYRGSLQNVAERLIAAADWCRAEGFVRISADSPLIIANVADEVISLYQQKDADLATNVQTRTFPKGLSVEVVRVSALRRAQPMMLAGEAEHVTSVFYRRAQEFRIVNLSSSGNWGSIQMSVETEADFALAERVIVAAEGSLDGLNIPDLIALRERCLSELRS